MSQLPSLLTLQGQLALLMLTGVFIRKVGMVDEKGKQFLTDLVINLVLPCNIIQSFRIPFHMDVLRSTFSVLLISLFLQIGCAAVSRFAYGRYAHARRAVMQYGTVCSNSGFLGNPIAEGIFGSEGQLLASIFLIPQRIVMWSTGIGYFMANDGQTDPAQKREHRKAVLKKTLTHPCILAAAIGMVIMLLQIPLPAFLGNTIKSFSSCNTALSMLLIGIIMGGSSFRHPLDRDVVLYCVIRLLLIPLGLWLGCLLFRINTLTTGVSVVLAAMPMGGTTAILAAKYGADAPFAAKCIAVSTVLSLLTTPLWCLVL